MPEQTTETVTTAAVVAEARVLRAAEAWADRRPSVPEATRELLAAVKLMRDARREMGRNTPPPNDVAGELIRGD